MGQDLSTTQAARELFMHRTVGASSPDGESSTRLVAGGGLSIDAALTIDECLERAGGWSTYQQRLMLWLGACTAACSIHMLQPIFLLSTIDWPLTSIERGLITSVFFAGYAVGVFAWAHTSDQRGRRPTIIVALLVGNVGGVGSFFCPSLYPFLAMRCLCGFGVAGAKNSLFLLATEFAPPAERAPVTARISYAWVSGLFFLVAVAWSLRHAHWRWLVVAHLPVRRPPSWRQPEPSPKPTGCMRCRDLHHSLTRAHHPTHARRKRQGLLVQLLLPSVLPESPRFQLVAGDAARARHTVASIFKANGAPPPRRHAATRLQLEPHRSRPSLDPDSIPTPRHPHPDPRTVTRL